MRRRALFLYAGLLSLMLLGTFEWRIQSYAADDSNRTTEIVMPYTKHEWWLTRWSDNQAVCQLFADHEELPTPNEILTYCGSTLYSQWKNTTPCQSLTDGSDTTNCRGYYLHSVSSEPSERIVVVDLPEVEVFVSLLGCTASPLGNLCKQIPSLLLEAQEPLPNEYVLAINGTLNGEPFSCAGEVCEIPLRATVLNGSEVEFWADSSYGDSSEHYQAIVRVVDTGVTEDPAQSGWYVDILSSQWRGDEPIASCAKSWEAFPPIGKTPLWLANPEKPKELASTEPYVYLAGRLIASDIVDAADCPGGGLQEDGWANACGLEKARQTVDQWQNRFDEQIIAAAQNNRIPSQLLKNLFAQESQFWPGSWRDAGIQEFGLGRMTEQGADTILLWNPAFYNQFCPLIFDASTCQSTYSELKEDDQATLRGALILSINADCENCPSGIDLESANFSIDLFAHTLQANCDQTAQIVSLTTKMTPGIVASYEDLWRFTLANYHAGPGCLLNAVQETWSRREPLSWSNVSANLEPGCQTAIAFVHNIAQMDSSQTQFVGPTREPATTTTPSEQPTATPTPEVTTPPSPTSTPETYPPPVFSPTPNIYP